MEKITLTCVENNNTKEAEVIEHDDLYMKVHVPGTELFIELYRKDTDEIFMGKQAGLTFEWHQKD